MYKTRLANLIDNRHLIPDEFWVNGAVWFFNYDEGGYSWSASRLGFNKEGKILWAFDSGCSCNAAWENFDPSKCTTIERKTFIIEDFMKESDNQYWDGQKPKQEEVEEGIKDYELLVRNDLSAEEVLSAKNAEIRRYLIKRIGYETIKDKVKAVVLHVDGDNELLKFENGEMYVKVRDSSTDRDYLLFVDGNHQTCRSAIAWTFGLREEEYNPLIET